MAIYHMHTQVCVCECVHGQNMCQISSIAVSPSALAHCPQRLDANGAALLLPFGQQQSGVGS